VAIVSPDKVEVRSIHLDLREHTMTTATRALAELAEKGCSRRWAIVVHSEGSGRLFKRPRVRVVVETQSWPLLFKHGHLLRGN
jgi:hypothetical protein